MSLYSGAQALIKDNIYEETIFKDAKRYKSLGWFVEHLLYLSQEQNVKCHTQTSTTYIYADMIMKWKPDWWGCAAPGTPPSPENAQWGKVKQVLLEVNTLSPSIWGDTIELMEFLPRSLSFRSCGQWPAHTWVTRKVFCELADEDEGCTRKRGGDYLAGQEKEAGDSNRVLANLRQRWE